MEQGMRGKVTVEVGGLMSPDTAANARMSSGVRVLTWRAVYPTVSSSKVMFSMLREAMSFMVCVADWGDSQKQGACRTALFADASSMRVHYCRHGVENMRASLGEDAVEQRVEHLFFLHAVLLDQQYITVGMQGEASQIAALQ